MSKSGKKVLIVGPGAMGCLLGVCLRRAGVKVVMLARSLESARALREKGLVFIGQEREERFEVEVLGPSDDKVAGVDLVALCVKSAATVSALRGARKHLGKAKVLVFQNGLRWPEEVAAEIEEERVFGASTLQGARRVGVGRVEHNGEGLTTVAALREGEASLESSRALAQWLTEKAWPSVAESSLQALLWGKAVVNAAINALTALLLVPNGALLESEAALGLADEAAKETLETALALGVECQVDATFWRGVARRTAMNGSSTLQDVLGGRRTEIGSINEFIAEKGQGLGVDVRVNKMLATLIRAREQSYLQSRSIVGLEWAAR